MLSSYISFFPLYFVLKFYLRRDMDGYKGKAKGVEGKWCSRVSLMELYFSSKLDGFRKKVKREKSLSFIFFSSKLGNTNA